MAILNVIGNTNASVGGPVSASIGQPVQFTATGGIKTNFQSGSFVYTSHTFTSSGTFVINDGQILATALLVAGGGGGRSGSVVGVGGEGGGAGGYIAQTVFFNTASIQIPYVTSSFAITVGAGGAQNNSGSNSILSGSIDYDSKPPVLIAYGGGAGSGSGASGGGEGFSLYPTQGNNGGFRYASNLPSNVSTSSYYSAPGGGSYITTGSAMTYGAHKYWRMITVSGSTPQIASIYFVKNYQSTASAADQAESVFKAYQTVNSGIGGLNCSTNTGMFDALFNSPSLNSGSTSNGESGSIKVEIAFDTPQEINNIFFRAPYLPGNNTGNCSGSIQGGDNVVLLQYRQNDQPSGSWINKMSGTLTAQQDYWLPFEVDGMGTGYICPGTGQFCGGTMDTTKKSGTFQMISQSFYEGGNIAGTPGQSISNTLIDGTEKWYSGAGGGGAWSGVTSGSAYIQDENATAALNAGVGGESGSLNGGNGLANSGCGGGGGAVNASASLRGTGGSGGSGVVVITYISGSAI